MNAKQVLGAQDLEITERQYFKQKPTVDEVRAIAALLPNGARQMLSTRSRRFKELALEGKELSENELIKLLAQEPGLWRRPIVITGGKAVVGFDAQALGVLLT